MYTDGEVLFFLLKGVDVSKSFKNHITNKPFEPGGRDLIFHKRL